MTNLLRDNAYHILGLDPSSSEKEILKRSKEIINRLQVEDVPTYPMDPGIFLNYRTLETVKQATQALQSAKQKLREYFFWFQISDGIDEKAFDFVKKGNFAEAINCWKEASNGQTAKALLYKKNLAILYCLLMLSDKNKQYLDPSISAWKEIIESDRFWTAFSKLYLLHNELSSSQEMIDTFKVSVAESLSDLYAELHDINDDPAYINNFRKAFNAKGQGIEKSVLNPAFQSISNVIERLEKTEPSKKGVFSSKEESLIVKDIEDVHKELHKLKEVGLYNDSQTVIMRDRAANAIRSIVLDLHNNMNEFEKAGMFLGQALEVCGSDSLRNKLKAEQEQIRNNLKDVEDNHLEFDIPGVSGGTVRFTNTYVEFREKKILYRDVERIAYYAQNTSFNLIPVSQSYSYWIRSDKDVGISFNFSTTLYIGNKSKQEVWVKLAGISEKMIEPHIVKKLVDRIFDRKETVKIGNVEFTREGYSRKKFFGGNEMVPWKGKIYIPKFHQGKVILWKDNNGKSTQFVQINMSDSNAVVLPQLVQACYDRVN